MEFETNYDIVTDYNMQIQIIPCTQTHWPNVYNDKMIFTNNTPIMRLDLLTIFNCKMLLYTVISMFVNKWNISVVRKCSVNPVEYRMRICNSKKQNMWRFKKLIVNQLHRNTTTFSLQEGTCTFLARPSRQEGCFHTEQKRMRKHSYFQV